MNLYVTADKIGETSGGGIVTHHELEALQELGDCEVWDRLALVRKANLTDHYEEPWVWDDIARNSSYFHDLPKLAHFYAGTFSKTVRFLKDKGTKVTYTAAAHDIQKSRAEHEKLGIPFAERYPHLVIPEQWERYVDGYLQADVLICPSSHSATVMRSYGYTGRIEIIPHGVLIPEGEPAPVPKTFTIGYLGSYGPDKGVIYLLEAWKRLNYSDAVLVLGGRDSQSPFVQGLIEQYGGGNIVCLGWVHNPIHFYNSLSLYCQPSITEGWGCEVLEAFACGRSVICSDGAGAADAIGDENFVFPAGDVDDLAESIAYARRWKCGNGYSEQWREKAKPYEWSRVRERYKQVWRSLL